MKETLSPYGRARCKISPEGLDIDRLARFISQEVKRYLIKIYQRSSALILFITMMYHEPRTFPLPALLLDKLTSAPTVPFFICSRQPARLLFVNHFIGKKAPLRSKNAYYWNDIV